MREPPFKKERATHRTDRARLAVLVVTGLFGGGFLVACGSGSNSPVDVNVSAVEDGFVDVQVDSESLEFGEDGPEDQSSDADAAEEDHTELSPPDDIRCGNGMIEPGEDCDDGNRLNHDACDWQCRWGEGEDPPVLPPDPDVGRAEPDLPPTPLDLDVAYPDYVAWAGGGQRLPLTNDGSAYATVWPHPESADVGAPLNGTFIRFDATGRRLDATWTYRLSSDLYAGVLPVPRVDLAWTGTRYGLLWAGTETWPSPDDPGVSFMALDADGKPIGDPVVVSTNGNDSDRLGIAWDGVGFAVVGDSFARDDLPSILCGLRLGLDGNWRDSERTLISPYDGDGPNALASSEDLYVAVWLGGGETGEWTIRYGLMSADGRALGTTSLGPPSGWAGLAPDVAWSGEEFGIAWPGGGPDVEASVLYFARLSRTGRLLGPPVPVFSSPSGADPEMEIAFGNGTYAIGWFGPDGAHLVRLDRNGTFVEHVVGSLDGTFAQSTIGLAADNTGFGLIGSEEDPAVTYGVGGTPFFTRFRVVR
jgi:cysteine-rich repeat protein